MFYGMPIRERFLEGVSIEVLIIIPWKEAGTMKRRDFIKKAGIGAAAVAATSVNAPFADAKQKGIVDFALDAYFSNNPGLQLRLRDGWEDAMTSDNRVEAVYLLLSREGYDATYGECLKFVKVYDQMIASPPWPPQQQAGTGDPIAY